MRRSVLLSLALITTASFAASQQQATPADLAGSFSVRIVVAVRGGATEAYQGLPALLTNKHWERGEVRDFTTNNAYGLGRESGEPGFALTILPDGAFSFHAGDGTRRIDHRPEAADQGIADGRFHEIGFAIDREAGVARLFHDGRRVALHDLQGVGDLTGPLAELRAASIDGIAVDQVRLEAGAIREERVRLEFIERFGKDRAPTARPSWDGSPLRVLAWNIWHGGRRKGRDEGVQRVVDVIRDCGADIVLMQETYGSGPRIAGRLGFDYFLRSSNLSVMSRYPITEVHRLYQGFRFGGVTIALNETDSIHAYTLWINYLPDVGKQLEQGATGESLAREDAKTRGKEIEGILAELLPHLAKTPDTPVLVGGDFNSGSHLDWTEAARGLPNHRGRIVAWPVSVAMQREGFVDTYRLAHPDPTAMPGHTWSPEFRDAHQDRIDYVYARGPRWRVVGATILSNHEDGWPSDHAASLTVLALSPR